MEVLSVGRSSLRAVVLVAAAAGCVPRAAAPPHRARALYHYKIDASAAPTLKIEASFTPGSTTTLAMSADLASATKLEVLRGGSWSFVSREGSTWTVPECTGACTVRYEVSLASGRDGMEGDSISVVNGSWLAPTYEWMVHPAPIMHATFEAELSPAQPVGDTWRDVAWAGQLRDLGGGVHGFSSGDYNEGTFVAFGKLRARSSRVAGGELTAVRLDGPLAMDEASLGRWVDDAAGAVATLYGGRFPVAHASIFLRPIPGADEPVFGRVLSLGGSSILVLTGEQSDGAAMHDDWILVHEMIHLGFPTFQNEGRWFDEGMATYYEPVLRTRMGWRDRTDLWRGLAREMPRGLATSGEPLALERRTTLDGIYWGGALFMLMADVRIREETHGAKSFDDVLRGVLARGGDGEHVWSVAEVVRVGDELTGTRVLADMSERYVKQGEAVDLEAELRALGVDRTGKGDEVTLHDDRPRAWIRRAIVSKDGR